MWRADESLFIPNRCLTLFLALPGPAYYPTTGGRNSSRHLHWFPGLQTPLCCLSCSQSSSAATERLVQAAGVAMIRLCGRLLRQTAWDSYGSAMKRGHTTRVYMKLIYQHLKQLCARDLEENSTVHRADNYFMILRKWGLMSHLFYKAS